MNATHLKRDAPLRDPKEEPPSKRRRYQDINGNRLFLKNIPLELLPLSDPLLPDDIWRIVLYFLDVGDVAKRMSMLSRNWSRSCWRMMSAFISGPTDTTGQGAHNFKYRPMDLMNQLTSLPSPQYLKTLTLDRLKLTEPEVEPIYHFSNLTQLELLVVRGRTFQKLSRLSSLQCLTTWNCEWVNTEVLREVGSLTRLERLTLNWCDQVNDDGLRHLSNLTNLLSLGLNDLTDISAEGLRHLSTLTNLCTLTLAYNPVSDSMVSVIAEHHALKLQVLDLDAASLGEGLITDAGLVALGKLTNLRRLKLGYHSFTPAGLKCLGSLTNLETLSLEYAENCVTKESLQSLSKLVHLRKLNLDSCSSFDDGAMSSLVHFTELEHLNIAKTMFKRGLQYLSSETHPKLKYLDISFCEKIDDSGFKNIGKLSNLESLVIYRCPPSRHLTPRGTRALLALRKLIHLDCRDCPLSTEVVQTLKLRIKDMKDTFMMPTTGGDDKAAPESEELFDSYDEEETTTNHFVSSETMMEINTRMSETIREATGTNIENFYSPVIVEGAMAPLNLNGSILADGLSVPDDLRNYEVEELDSDSEIGSSMDVDVLEEEGDDEVDDRQLLAALRVQRCRSLQPTPPPHSHSPITNLSLSSSSIPKSMLATLSSSYSDEDIEEEELED